MAYRNKNTLWISYSAISDFEKCPKLYYLKSIYRDPKTNSRIQLINPYLSLGSAVHEVIEEIRLLNPEERFKSPLAERFEKVWQNYLGKKGGFGAPEEEEKFKVRGENMLARVEQNSTVLKNITYFLGESFPKVRLFREEDIILVGNLDWVEILPNGNLHIIDFKTGQKTESGDSLQLPIYLILANYNFKKPVEKVSYWYLGKDDRPTAMQLNPMSFYAPILKKKALAIKDALENNKFTCQSGYKNCFNCYKYSMIVRGRGEFIGYDRKMNKDIYFIPND